MDESDEPTWRLVLLAAQRLDRVADEFRLADLVGPGRTPGDRAARTAEVVGRLADVTRDFEACLEAYDRQVSFQRSG